MVARLQREVNFFCALEPAQHAVIAKSPLNNRGRYQPESVNDLVNNRSSLARKLAVRARRSSCAATAIGRLYCFGSWAMSSIYRSTLMPAAGSSWWWP